MLKVIELFAGIGSQTQALKNIGFEHEVVGIAEIDEYATVAYASNHCGYNDLLGVDTYRYVEPSKKADILARKNIGFDFKNNKPFDWHKLIGNSGEKKLDTIFLAVSLSNNFGDISKIEKLDYADLWTYSFPCQDLSVAGKGAGIKEGTRSGLLYEVERLLEASERPKYLLMENVKNLVGKKHKADFDIWLEKLKELGYTNYWQVLNAKDYGVPQNRERVFCMSIRNDVGQEYIFPEKKELQLRLADILDDEVDEKYYVSQDKIAKLIMQIKDNKRGTVPTSEGVSVTSALGSREHRCSGWDEEKVGTLCARDYKDPKVAAIPNRVGGFFDKDGRRRQAGAVWDAEEGLSPTLNTMQGGNREPKVLVKTNTKKGHQEAKEGDSINFENLNSDTRRGRVGVGVAQTLTTSTEQATLQNYIIRKLMPVECWCLMGFKSQEYEKARAALEQTFYNGRDSSNSQMYKMAGNSIVVDVLEEIFENLKVIHEVEDLL